MEDECYEEELEHCEEFPFDTFGGQTKALRGFKTYNIEGAELYNMGQVHCFVELIYRVTHHIVSNLPLTSKKSSVLVLMFTYKFYVLKRNLCLGVNGRFVPR